MPLRHDVANGENTARRRGWLLPSYGRRLITCRRQRWRFGELLYSGKEVDYVGVPGLGLMCDEKGRYLRT
jgi:hypothetical protein